MSPQRGRPPGGARDERGFSPELALQIRRRMAEFEQIPPGRARELEAIAEFAASRLEQRQTARLTFVCTHNSRRSQMARLWAWAAAVHFGVPGLETFAGGTEVTAFHPNAVAALERAGFVIRRMNDGANPRYEVRLGGEGPVAEVRSRIHDEPPNPTGDHAAIMTCTEADRACPASPGAAFRMALPYDDPGASDGTGREAEVYDERCREIARDMLYIVSRIRA